MKTKVITNSIKCDITLGGTPLEYIETYTYLVKRISFDTINNEAEVLYIIISNKLKSPSTKKEKTTTMQ